MSSISFTGYVHQRLGKVIAPGDRCVDATAGNGHDTVFLARQVGARGAVAVFDCQATAIEATRCRLRELDLLGRCALHPVGHQHMTSAIPADWVGQVAAVTFNLGYLPGSDHRVVTLADTTVSALQQSAALLRQGGWLSVLVYRGHPGSDAEATAVRDWWRRDEGGFDIEVQHSPGPVLYLARKR